MTQAEGPQQVRGGCSGSGLHKEINRTLGFLDLGATFSPSARVPQGAPPPALCPVLPGGDQTVGWVSGPGRLCAPWSLASTSRMHFTVISGYVSIAHCASCVTGSAGGHSTAPLQARFLHTTMGEMTPGPKGWTEVK